MPTPGDQVLVDVNDVRVEVPQRASHRQGSARTDADRYPRAVEAHAKGPADDPHPGFGGRPVPWRDHEDLVAARREMRGQLADVHLYAARRVPIVRTGLEDLHGCGELL